MHTHPINNKLDQNKTSINMYNPEDVDLWASAFNVSNQDIINAIAKVGTSSDDIKAYLWDEKRNFGENPFLFHE